MERMNQQTIAEINGRLFFGAARQAHEVSQTRPWQYLAMEYERVGLNPPIQTPHFSSMEQAEIWMCLDQQYNKRLREMDMPVAV